MCMNRVRKTGAYCRHLANTISHLNYLLRRRCGLPEIELKFKINASVEGTEINKIHRNIDFLTIANLHDRRRLVCQLLWAAITRVWADA